MINITVIIPAFNEEERLGPSVEKIVSFLERQGKSYEIIIVDDGSTDKTLSVAEQFAAHDAGAVKVLKNEMNRGKGFSVKQGVAAAAGELILFSDADLSTPMEELSSLEAALNATGAAVAAGSRAMAGSKIIRHQPFYREFMGKVFNKIARLLTFGGIKDSQCGFKLFRREAAKKLFLLSRIDGFAFDAEIIFLAQKKGYEVVEVPVRWTNSPNTRVSAIRDSSRMFAELVKIRMNYLARRYN
ncbi:MAG: glycosyltransferase family 2 protein [Endomicrobiia bacterium]|nr:glycosyltransferase family 2 protein [Endomicrobiia bacterium]